jgi:hypothetical protein
MNGINLSLKRNLSPYIAVAVDPVNFRQGLICLILSTFLPVCSQIRGTLLR